MLKQDVRIGRGIRERITKTLQEVYIIVIYYPISERRYSYFAEVGWGWIVVKSIEVIHLPPPPQSCYKDQTCETSNNSLIDSVYIHMTFN